MARVAVSGRRARRKAVLSTYNALAFSLGAYFQQAREQKKLDQEAVAKQSGMQQTHVSWIETAEWQNAGPERIREYIRTVGIPNETALMEVIAALDIVAKQLPRALA